MGNRPVATNILGGIPVNVALRKSGLRNGWCAGCLWKRITPVTHLVKFPASRYDDDSEPDPGPRVLRYWACAEHAAAIVRYQHSIGVMARAYRHRVLPR